MIWTRKDRYYSDSDKGYRISATSDGHGGWRFTAWGPAMPNWHKIRLAKTTDWDQVLKERYEIGEKVPSECELIDSFDDVDQAKQACEDHWRQCNDEAA